MNTVIDTVQASPDSKSGVRLTLAILAALADETGRISASLSDLAALCNCTTQAVSKNIKKLIDLGDVSCVSERQGNAPAQYLLMRIEVAPKAPAMTPRPIPTDIPEPQPKPPVPAGLRLHTPTASEVTQVMHAAGAENPVAPLYWSRVEHREALRALMIETGMGIEDMLTAITEALENGRKPIKGAMKVDRLRDLIG